MRKIKIILLVISCLFVNSLLADVIYFSNGDIDEGHVKSNGDRFIISTKDMTGSYGIQTNKVLFIKYGEWLENLDEATQKVAENTKKTKSITSGKVEDTIIEIEGKLPKQISKSIDISKLKVGNPMIWVMGSLLVVFIILSTVCIIFLLIDAFKYSLAWGLCSLFIPFVIWIYLFTNYSGNKGKMFLGIISPFLWIILSFSVLMLTK